MPMVEARSWVMPAVSTEPIGAESDVVDGIGSQLLLGLLPRERAAALIEQSIELELSGRTQLGPA